MNTIAEDAPRAGWREWVGLGVLALACVVYAMDLTVLELAVPALTQDLRPTSPQLLWIVDVYGFFVAGLLVTMGALGDRIGRRRLLMIGAGAFGVVSVLAAFSTSAEMLLASRALLGVAGATVAPSTLALISNVFPDGGQRTVAIGVWISSFSAGAVVGPLAGGLLMEFFWWGSVFLLGVPVMLLLLALGPVLLPEYRDPEAGRLDLASVALSLVGVLAAIYGLKRIAAEGAGWPAVAAVAIGLALGAAFVLRQQRIADPLLDLRLFRVPAFGVALAAHTLAFFALGGALFFIAQYLQLVLGLPPLRAGLWMVPPFVAFIVGSMLTAPIARRVRPAFVMTAGLALSAVGFLMLTGVGEDSGLALLASGSFVFSLGLAPVFILATDMIVGSAPPERAGAASAISETGSELGGALGIAVLGSVGAAVYRGLMGDAVPAGVPPGAAQAARNTLGGAAAVSDRLPDQAGAELLDAAREAFVQGLQLTALASAVIVAALAVLVALLLRDVRTGSEPTEMASPNPDASIQGPLRTPASTGGGYG